MKRAPLFCTAAFLVALAGCATLSKSELAELRRHNVSMSLCDRMEQRREILLPDIIELSKKRVPDGVIVHYLQITNGIYSLRTDDVLRLRKDGVSADVIDYMLRTPELNSARYAPYPLYDSFYYQPPVIVVERGHGHRH